MPFADELSPDGVVVAPYRPEWATEADALAHELRRMLPSALAVEHIGSTSIVGMAAKNCLDMMVVVDSLDDPELVPAMESAGYRRRPEVWNLSEEAGGRSWPKLVFAPPVGGRPRNIHIRTRGSGSARLALLFRDHLRASPDRMRWWSELKTEAARTTSDLAGYGRIKYPAWRILMELAESWAAEQQWEPPAYR